MGQHIKKNPRQLGVLNQSKTEAQGRVLRGAYRRSRRCSHRCRPLWWRCCSSRSVLPGAKAGDKSGRKIVGNTCDFTHAAWIFAIRKDMKGLMVFLHSAWTILNHTKTGWISLKKLWCHQHINFWLSKPMGNPSVFPGLDSPGDSEVPRCQHFRNRSQWWIHNDLQARWCPV